MQAKTPPRKNKGLPRTESTLTSENQKALKAAFDSFDTDGNGLLSKTEIRGVLKKFSSDPNGTIGDEEIEDIIGQFTDGEEVSFEDFKTFMLQSTAKEKELHLDDKQLRESFNIFDQNNDGLISCAELFSTLQKFDSQMTKTECDNMFRSADTNNDGKISFEEFKILMASPS